ncbi:hypothetical protein [Streptomyces violascens]|uniref:Uncharacterized protein n=1 Tax=Streptomyces violascens TaxID=67381 RepID=A0ABQ3QL59_9ACTN|nr:hypothetical protein [Streptomyces violascens]GGU44557.1 hypothetical protein GCM10010289_76430 [Streptomyces violascens]GHI38014.1 hypothetical protein Sviol_24220 [Streptomyces violascens]
MPTPRQNAPKIGDLRDLRSSVEAPVGPPGPDPNALDFPPVRNGVDYLLSVVDHLTADPVGPRHVKYAVLHLQAAAEVLLKARLVREHWSLVFDDPGAASEKAFRSADFKSCTVGEAVTRLRNIAGVTITDKDQEALAALGRDRNALQHYGLSHNARAVEARAGRVLDFLMRFLDDVLVPGLRLDEVERITADVRRIRRGLTGVHAFITQRLRRLSGDLKGCENRTVLCPYCGQMTLVVEKPLSTCLFCDAEVGASEMTTHLFLNTPEGEASRTAFCPDCAEYAVGRDTLLATGGRADFCFWCVGPVSLPPTTPSPKPSEHP